MVQVLNPEPGVSTALLVRRAVRRDSDAFGELYGIYQPAIKRYITNHIGSGPEAEDLAGRVFLNAWQAIDRYEDRGRPFSSWLYRLAHNQVVDHHRSRRPTSNLPDNLSFLISPDQAFAEVERKHLNEELKTAMSVLTAEQRQIITWKFLEGQDNQTIAGRMRKTVGAVRAMQMRALGALRRELELRSRRAAA